MKSIANLSQGDIDAVLRIVDRMTNVDVQIEVDGMKLHVRKFDGNGVAPQQDAAPSRALGANPDVSSTERPLDAPATTAVPPVIADHASAASESGLLDVRAPMLGRFYRAASPSEPPLVDVGSKVGPEDPICVIEVMKLFSTVPAGVSGTVVEIVAQDGELVACDAVLFRVRPQ